MASSAGVWLSATRRRMMFPLRAAGQAVVQTSPVPGNSPDARKDYPDLKTSQKSWIRCPPTRSLTRTVARRQCALAGEPQARHLAFCRHRGIYRSDVGQNHSDPRVGRRLPLVGPQASVEDATEGARLGSSSAMSSGRLFLDRVARQHCPSPLHRHAEHNTHPTDVSAKGDISTLPPRGHFYFALTS
jgi:hypothetical protein